MADVKVRKLEDWVVAAHQARALRAGRSLEEELRIRLTESAMAAKRELAQNAASLREELRAKYGTLPDSGDLIRAERRRKG